MKTKRKNATWESESSIKLLYVQSHTPPYLQSFVHGCPTFLQEQCPEHPLSDLYPHFVSFLHVLDTLGCVIQHGTKLFPCLFHPNSFGLGGFCVGFNDQAQTNAAWHTALRTCCFNESCVWGKFSSCRPYLAKPVLCIYLLHIWLMQYDTLNRQIFWWYSFHFR